MDVRPPQGMLPHHPAWCSPSLPSTNTSEQTWPSPSPQFQELCFALEALAVGGRGTPRVRVLALAAEGLGAGRSIYSVWGWQPGSILSSPNKERG